MAREITGIQRQVLAYLIQFVQKHGFPPNVRELKDQFGWSANASVGNHLKSLEAKGFIRRYSNGRLSILKNADGMPVHLTFHESTCNHEVPGGCEVCTRANADLVSRTKKVKPGQPFSWTHMATFVGGVAHA